MADEAFRPKRPNKDVSENESNEANETQESYSPVSESQPSEGGSNVQIKGNIPAEFARALKEGRGESTEPKSGFSSMGEEKEQKMKSFDKKEVSTGHLKELLEIIKGSSSVYEEIQLPSKGRFYDGENGPSNGVVSIRPMTGEEEQILATPRFVRKGQAINMIFQKCLKEGNQFKSENLLSVDRTFLLIYLRGISYTPKYEVEIKCPECDAKFSTTIDLNALYVESCPDTYGPNLKDVLPTTKLPFTYRLSTGKDEPIRNFITYCFQAISVDIEWRGSGIHEKGYQKDSGNLLVEVDPEKFRPGDIVSQVSNPQKIKNKFGWEAKLSLSEIAEKMVQFDINIQKQRSLL